VIASVNPLGEYREQAFGSFGSLLARAAFQER